MTRAALLETWRGLPLWVRRVGVAVVGGALIAGGVAMLVLPGPGLVAIAAGLGVLATEFAWARRLLQRVLTWISEHRPRRGSRPGGEHGAGDER